MRSEHSSYSRNKFYQILPVHTKHLLTSLPAGNTSDSTVQPSVWRRGCKTRGLWWVVIATDDPHSPFPNTIFHPLHFVVVQVLVHVFMAKEKLRYMNHVSSQDEIATSKFQNMKNGATIRQ